MRKQTSSWVCSDQKNVPAHEINLEEAIDCLNALGMIHRILPKGEKYFAKHGITVQNSGQEPVLFFIIFDKGEIGDGAHD